MPMTRYCPSCGTAAAEGARFCQNCGHTLGQADEAAAPEAAPSDQAAIDPPAAGSAEPSFVDADDGRSPRRTGLLVGVGAAALLAVGAGLWYGGVLGGPGSGAAVAESAPAAVDYDLMPIAFGDRCGFVDETGKVVINPQFDAAGMFLADLDLAPIRVGGKWGLIDRKGQFVVNPQFDFVQALGNPPVLAALAGQKWGIIDGKGAFVVNPQFDHIGAFDKDGRALAVVGEKWGLIDRTGKFVVDPQFDSILTDAGEGGSVGYFSNGLAAAQADGKWGFIDAKGKWVVNPQFASVSAFGEGGLAGVQIGGGGDSNRLMFMQEVDYNSSDLMGGNDMATVDAFGNVAESAPAEPAKPRWGYIDKTGKIVIQPQFDFAGRFSGAGLAPVRLGDLWGYIDRAGTIKITPQYAYATEFVAGPAGWVSRIATDGGPGNPWRWGVIDKNGTVKINPQFNGLDDFDESGHAVVQVGDNYGLLSAEGKLVVNPVYARLSWLPGTGRYFYLRKTEGGAQGIFEMGMMKPDGEILSTMRGGLCSDGNDED